MASFHEETELLCSKKLTSCVYWISMGQITLFAVKLTLPNYARGIDSFTFLTNHSFQSTVPLICRPMGASSAIYHWQASMSVFGRTRHWTATNTLYVIYLLTEIWSGVRVINWPTDRNDDVSSYKSHVNEIKLVRSELRLQTNNSISNCSILLSLLF